MTIQVFLNTMRMANETVSFTTEGDAIGIDLVNSKACILFYGWIKYVRMETIYKLGYVAWGSTSFKVEKDRL